MIVPWRATSWDDPNTLCRKGIFTVLVGSVGLLPATVLHSMIQALEVNRAHDHSALVSNS